MKRLIKIGNTLLLAFVFSFLLFLYIQQGPQAVVNISMPSLFVALILFVFSFAEVTYSARSRRPYRGHGDPGAMFMKLARYLYSEKTVEEIFEPTQRDFLDEYADAKSEYILAEDVGSISSSSWWIFRVRCKYYFAFLRAVVRQNFVTMFVRRVYFLLVQR